MPSLLAYIYAIYLSLIIAIYLSLIIAIYVIIFFPVVDVNIAPSVDLADTLPKKKRICHGFDKLLSCFFFLDKVVKLLLFFWTNSC